MKVKVQVREEITAKYADHLEMIIKFLSDCEKLDEVVLMLSQCRGTLASLTLFKEQGIPILDAVLAKLAKDEVDLLVEAKELDVEDLPSSVLYATPPHNTFIRDVPAEVSVNVDQHGTNERRVSPKDVADLASDLAMTPKAACGLFFCLLLLFKFIFQIGFPFWGL